jgi:Na+-driven multidrug efflux pump
MYGYAVGNIVGFSFLSFFLIGPFGIEGVAVAVLISVILRGLLTVFLVRRVFDIPVFSRQSFRRLFS